MRPLPLLFISLLLLSFIVSCSSPKSEFEEVKKADTIEAYQAFLIKYPNSKFVDAAKNRVKQLEVEEKLEQGQRCCVCDLDEKKESIKVIPWNKDDKKWEEQYAQWVYYSDKTKIMSITIEALKKGEVARKEVTLMSYFVKEIKKVSDLVGNILELKWNDETGNRVLTEMELVPVTRGGTYDGYISLDSRGGKSFESFSSMWTTECFCNSK